MSIPKPTSIKDTFENMHYMSFEEVQVLPFGSKHLPPLKATTLRIASDTKRKGAIARAQLRAARVATSLPHNMTKSKHITASKIAFASRVRGVVDCKSCLKPRCIYSHSALSQMKPPLSRLIPDNN